MDFGRRYDGGRSIEHSSAERYFMQAETESTEKMKREMRFLRISFFILKGFPFLLYGEKGLRGAEKCDNILGVYTNVHDTQT